MLNAKVPFQWGDEQIQAFDKIKSLLVNSPLLAFPRFDLEFHLSVDSSKYGTGSYLWQIWPDSEFKPNTPEKDRVRIIRFGSKSFQKWQHNYGPTKLELLGMTTSILDCASYLRGHKFTVYCDNQALAPLFQKKLKGAKIGRAHV